MANTSLNGVLHDERRPCGAIARERHEEPDTEREDHAQIFLLGQSSLGRFLEFVDKAVVDGAKLDRATLTAEWRAAIDYYEELEETEAGLALLGDHRELDPSLSTLAAQATSHPSYRRTFDILPTCLGMVELDRLIVYQRSMTRNYVDKMRARIGSAPDAATLFRVCLPLDTPAPPVQVRRIDRRRFVFSSESTHFRFCEPALLPAEQGAGHFNLGDVAGMLGFAVGFGSNFLNVVRVGNRYLLNNGYHRAYALRALGISHAPCVIQTATHVDELQVVVSQRVASEARFYLESARPPLLKDFFDPKLRKILPIRRRVRHIEVDFEIRDFLAFE